MPVPPLPPVVVLVLAPPVPLVLAPPVPLPPPDDAPPDDAPPDELPPASDVVELALVVIVEALPPLPFVVGPATVLAALLVEPDVEVLSEPPEPPLAMSPTT